MLAKNSKTPIGIPVILKIVEVQVAVSAVPVKIGHVRIAIGIPPNRAKYAKHRPCHHPLNALGIESDSESKYSLILCTKYLHFLGLNNPRIRPPAAVTASFH